MNSPIDIVDFAFFYETDKDPNLLVSSFKFRPTFDLLDFDLD